MSLKAHSISAASTVLYLSSAALWGTACFASSSIQTFDIPAGSASEALRQFSVQSKLQVLFNSDVVEDLNTPEVHGNLSAAEALKVLLERTELKYGFVNDRTVTVVRRGSGNELANKLPLAAQFVTTQSDGGASTPTQRSDASTSSNEEGQSNSKSAKNSVAESSQQRLNMPEVLVRGARSTNTDVHRSRDDIQPYVILDREKIQRSGATTVESFLKSVLPMNTANVNVDQLSGVSFLEGQINLRGLGTNQTLILIDGRRIPGVANLSGASAQPSISGIPLSSIERIEILPTTAGAIYGGSATGGVINIIRKRDFAGVDAGVTYGNTFSTDAQDKEYHINGGYSWRNTSFMVGASYSEGTPLLAIERDFAARSRALTYANSPNTINGAQQPPSGAISNICSARLVTTTLSVCSGVPLVLDNGQQLGSAITSVPYGYGGPGTDGGTALANSAGRYNIDIPNDGQYLVRVPMRTSVSFNLRHSVTEFLELQTSGSRNRTMNESPVGGNTVSVFVPATSANNPFQQNVLVNIPVAMPPRPARNDVELAEAAAGAVLHLPGGWSASLDKAWGRNRYSYGARVGGLLSSAELSALGSSNFPFQDLSLSSPVFSSINTAFDQTGGPFSQTVDSTTLRFSGPMLQLPGGPLMLTGLIERLNRKARDGFQTSLSPAPSTFYLPPRSQATDSYYLEATLPVISEQQRYPFVRALELQASIRHDAYKTTSTTGVVPVSSREGPLPSVSYYSNGVSSTDGLLGIKYTPVSDVSIRLSRSTGFLPAGLNQLAPSNTTVTNSSGADPRRGSTPILPPFASVTGGNPDIKPEQSTSWSAGLILAPRLLEGLRLSLDYTYIKKDDEITGPTLQYILNNEQFYPTRVTRGEKLPTDPADWAGPVTRIDTSLLNVLNSSARSLDLQLDYRWQTTEWGVLSFSAIASQAREFSRKVSVNAAMLDTVGAVDGPLTWKGTAEVSWEWNQWTASWASQYFDSYRVTSPNASSSVNSNFITLQGSAAISSQLYHDLFLSYRIPKNGMGWLSGISMSLGINNVLNTSPPILASSSLTSLGVGTYSTLVDPRLRRFSISIEKSFEY